MRSQAATSARVEVLGRLVSDRTDSGLASIVMSLAAGDKSLGAGEASF